MIEKNEGGSPKTAGPRITLPDPDESAPSSPAKFEKKLESGLELARMKREALRVLGPKIRAGFELMRKYGL